MEVTVIRMRRKGAKLLPEELEQAPRVHGHMEITYWILENGRERRKIKELIVRSHPNANNKPILKLTDPEQTQLKGDDMVYIGTETDDGEPWLQAWYVKNDPAPPSNGVRASEYANAGKRAAA